MAEGSLEFYCGGLGSGKTSFAFERGLERMLRGGTMVTNIAPIRPKIREWFAEEHGLEFDDSRLVEIEDGTDPWKYARVGTDELPSMLVLDEAHVEHNARDWNKSSAAQMLFNTMARKLKVDVIYITQDINNVDKQFRRMAQVIWYCRNAKQRKLLGGLIQFPFNLFFRVPYVCGPGVPPIAQSPEICFRPVSWGMFKTDHLVGKAASTFSVLAAAQASPLKRIPKPVKPTDWLSYAPLAASLALFL